LGYNVPALGLGDRAITILEELHERHPGEPKYGMALTDMYHDVAVSMKDVLLPAEIQRYHQAAVDLFERLEQEFSETRLAEEFPYGDALDRFVQSQMYRADVDTPKQRKLWRMAFDHFEGAVERAPQSLWHRRQLVEASHLLGDRLEDKAMALRSQEFFEDLHQEFPGVPEYRARLARSATNFGLLLVRRGQHREAEPRLRTAVQLMTALVNEFPDELDYQSELAAALHNLTLAHGVSDRAATRRLLERALEYELVAVQANPEHRRYWRFLANHYGQLAKILNELNRQEPSQDAVPKTLLLPKELAIRVPDEVLKKLLDSQHVLAGSLAELGQFQEAEQIYRQQIRAYQQLIEERGGEADELSWLAAAQSNLAMLLLDRDELEEAEVLLLKAIPHQLAALKASPGHRRVRDFLSKHHFVLSGVNAKLGNNREKEENLSEVIRLNPKHTEALNNLAWLLATCPDKERRDPARAVEFAKRAVGLAPNAMYRNTLGVAHYQAGEYKAVIGALEHSVQLSKGGNSFDYYFLAMAHWQLDAKKEAREWYDRAVEWMKQNKPNDEELNRYRAEAEMLMETLKQRKPKQVSVTLEKHREQ